MKATIPFFSFVLAFLCVIVSPQAHATCQDACLTNDNTVQGDDALISLTSGTDNTAIGFQALFNNTTGSLNTASGSGALFSNTGGNDNTAIGFDALFSNTTGCCNTASGSGALVSNTTGNDNTAIGFDTLFRNTTGGDNIAYGDFALGSNTTGVKNTAIGFSALEVNITGNNNTAVGWDALFLTTGGSNIAVGSSAGINLSTGSHNIDIGNDGWFSDSLTIRIGDHQTATYIAGVSGATVATGVPVIIDTTGHLGTTTSSARFKEAIKPMDKTSEVILALKPVTFHYKKELDPDGIPQFGLVAEDVEKVNSDLVARDDQGKPYTVRYEAVNAMLLNEFLKQHRTVQDLKATVAQQQKQIEALTAGLQKVSAQLELNKPAPQTVLNNR